MTTQQVRESLARAKRLFIERPLAAKKTNSSTAVWQPGGLACEVTSRDGHKIVTDMAKPMGGGAGLSPGSLLRASLASCTATAIAMRAALRGIELRELEATVLGEVDIRGAVGIDGVSLAVNGMRMAIKIGADNVAEDVLREIVEWGATQSTVSATLSNGEAVPFDVTVV